MTECPRPEPLRDRVGPLGPDGWKSCFIGDSGRFSSRTRRTSLPSSTPQRRRRSLHESTDSIRWSLTGDSLPPILVLEAKNRVEMSYPQMSYPPRSYEAYALRVWALQPPRARPADFGSCLHTSGPLFIKDQLCVMIGLFRSSDTDPEVNHVWLPDSVN